MSPTKELIDGSLMWRMPDGTLLPVISGGDGTGDDEPDTPDPDDEEPDEDDEPEGEDDPDPDKAGPKLLSALRSERKLRQAEEKARKKAEDDAVRLRKELQDMKAKPDPDPDAAIEAAKEEGRQAALQSANQRLVDAEIRAAATGKFSISPEQVVRLIDTEEITVADDGKVDTAAITKLLEELLEAEPGLAAKKKKPTGDPDGGGRGGGATDLESMGMDDYVEHRRKAAKDDF